MLTVTELDKTYTSEQRTHQAVRGISFDTRKGEFYTLLGPSGCGKSTTLRCIAGLEKPEHGEISIGQEVVFSGFRGSSCRAINAISGWSFSPTRSGHT